jgi:hypothetical protein
MYPQDFCGFGETALRLLHRVQDDLLFGLGYSVMIFVGRRSCRSIAFSSSRTLPGHS